MPDRARARARARAPNDAAHNPGRAPEIPQGAAFTQLMSLDRVTLEASDPEPAQTPTATPTTATATATATAARATPSSRPNPDGSSTETDTPPTSTPIHSSPVTPSAGRVEYFRARYAPYRNSIAPTAFGGHVYAQAAWAAAQTVPRGFVLHVSVK
ncbi:hypothetical protein KEM55_008405 [Ascosphaera atra]|nr:hypothetical protein KEM55_008405 [Ascosphaera atra]